MNARKSAMIYARVATQEQLKDNGLSTQVDACRKYANQHGLAVVVDQVITDPRCSGLALN
jgi:DNA invertase Pin-like site-specific DNA recombinase